MGTHHTGTETEVFALDAYIKLMRASQAVTARIHRPLARWKLTASQLGVLDALYHLGPLSQLELARKHLMSPGNITMVVDNLEKRRLVERQRRTDDRRVVDVHLTAEGKRLFKEVFPSHVKRITEAMDTLNGLELKELSRLCKELGLKGAGQKENDHE